ncbi:MULTISPECIES: class II aldolase/adducin family protein [Nostocales]|uniref:Class II aldolase/adducin family protein n=3 Tax=Nostocales TaxID=1161 RepID=A0A0C1R400_9CYAN|nr:class II aldolase/adducin family protein [Tolypothrix bouteillei]KAF3889575.1 class II aldolase/adducin family protein [Tolypothrix bouteillei VB521301]
MVQTSLVRNGSLTKPPTFTSVEAERRHRQERLAAALRIFARFDFALGLAGHITARDPELTDHFWVNPFGIHFSRVRVSDLILVNPQGEVVRGNGALNQAAFAIHSQIHEARPDIIAAAHAHSFYGKTWSSLGRLLDPITQDSAAFYQDHALFDDFKGIVLETSEGKRIAQALGDRKAAILRNHGLLTVGRSVDEAAWWFIRLEDAAKSQLLAEAVGKPILIDRDLALEIQKRNGTHEAGWRGFQYLWDEITHDQPDLLD